MKGFFKRAESFLDRAPELWKESVELVELNRRFLWFLILRFGVAISLFFFGIAKALVIPHLEISSTALFTVAAALIPINIFHWFYYEWATSRRDFPANARLVAGNVEIQIIIDFLFLGYLTYECGGLESPLIYFFLFHNILSCLFFSRNLSLLYTMVSIAIVLLIVSLMSSGALPERHFIDPGMNAGPLLPARFRHYYLVGVISVYLVAWYLCSTITKNLKIRERELQTKIQEMMDLAREKTRYLLVTTHELKAPFAAIQSYVNVALDGYAGELPVKVREILLKIRARCGMLANMITEMIQLANISSIKESRKQVTASRINVSAAILNAMRRFKEMSAAKNVVFETGRLSFKTHYIEADAQQIDVLLGNVIGNAVSYSYPNTKIEIFVDENDGVLTVRVKDRGIGIKKEHLEKVFLEHFRTEKAVEMNPNSTGLGLTIAKQIMDISGGRICIESKEGVGTEVYLQFPKTPAGAEQ